MGRLWMRPSREHGPRTLAWHWRARLLALTLICLLVPGCGITVTQVVITLAYASIGTCIALLVSPSLTAAIIGCLLGALIGAVVYNNSLKTDLMERQDWHRVFPENTRR